MCECVYRDKYTRIVSTYVCTVFLKKYAIGRGLTLDRVARGLGFDTVLSGVETFNLGTNEAMTLRSNLIV